MTDMQYSIKDLEKLSSIKAHTIRIWEKRYNIVKPDRTDTNIRYYDDEEMKHLMNISVLIHNGIKISHIAKLSHDEIKSKAYFLLQNNVDSDSQIKNLILSMLELNEAKFDKILAKSILNTGFEKTMIQLIYPFLQQIGVMWQTGSINPAQEHFISNLIRQKLIVSIDGLQFEHQINSKRFIMFLPEGEMHELGLLFYTYLVKARGHEVLYLGMGTPLNSVIESGKTWKTDYLCFFAVSAFSGIGFNDFLNDLSVQFSGQKIFVSGYQAVELKPQLPKNVILVANATEFISLINDLK